MVSLVGGLLLHHQTGIVFHKKKKAGVEQKINCFRITISCSPIPIDTIQCNVLHSDEM